MNELFKWESRLLKSDFKTKYSKFVVINRYFYSVIKEISFKVTSSKRNAKIMIKKNDALLAKTLKEAERDILKVARPLLDNLNKHYKIYNKEYVKYYSSCSATEKIGNLLPSDFKRISRTIFMQRYKNAEIDIKNSLNSHKVNLLNLVSEITNPFFDVFEMENKFTKKTSKNMTDLQKYSSNFKSNVDKSLKEMSKLIKTNEITPADIERYEVELIKSKNNVTELWVTFKENFQREIFKFEQTLLFNIIEANEYMDNKFNIVEEIREQFPDIKKVYVDRIEVIKDKISLIEEKMGEVVPSEVKKELRIAFIKDLDISQSFSDDIIDVTIENVRRQFSDVLNIIDYQVGSLNMIYTFFKSFQNNFRHKNLIVDGVLSNLTVSFLSMSSRIKNKLITSDEISDEILHTLEMEFKINKKKNTKRGAN